MGLPSLTRGRVYRFLSQRLEQLVHCEYVRECFNLYVYHINSCIYAVYKISVSPGLVQQIYALLTVAYATTAV
jgi:hypothetical protein